MSPADGALGPRTSVVALGGGHGLSRTLSALGSLDVEATAVVTVADDGGSSGRLRRERGIIALGDMRMALLAMARRADLTTLLSHRFRGGGLDEHALGNLALVAMVEQADGDVVAALARAAEMLDCHGRVWPCTTDDVTLVAAIDGQEVEGQVAVATTEGRRRVWLEPRAPQACQPAVDAITAADLLVLGPGSLFTSIIPNLLVPGIGEAISETAGRVLYVANLTAQAGETQGLDARGHVDALLSYLPDGLEVEVLCHDGPVPHGSGRALSTDVAGPGVSTVWTADLAEGAPGLAEGTGERLGAHDTDRLAAALRTVLRESPDRHAVR